MEKFFLKVLHEEPVAELSLHELVGGADCIGYGCNGFTFVCPCYGKDCNEDTCPANCATNCPSNCGKNGSFGSGGVTIMP